MSFYTSLTGLNAATAQLSVTSNNIANVGTTGFKRSRADFGDIFATSPLQKASSVIGQGVALKQVSQEFSQGNIQFSANSLDIAITGDGFFPLKSADGLQDIYTRNGTFMLNDSYNVVNSAGQALIAAAVDSSGKADLDNLNKLLIPRKTTGDAVATSAVQLGLNLPADAAVPTAPFDRNDETTYNKTTAVTVYDAGGNGYLATVYYRKTQVATPEDPTNKWQTYVYIGDTKLQELLIQSADKKGEKQYVNKYGEIRPESQIPPQDIARGVTKLFNLDDLKNPQRSEAATVSSGILPTSTVDSWKNGLTFPGALTTWMQENSGKGTVYTPLVNAGGYKLDTRGEIDGVASDDRTSLTFTPEDSDSQFRLKLDDETLSATTLEELAALFEGRTDYTAELADGVLTLTLGTGAGAPAAFPANTELSAVVDTKQEATLDDLATEINADEALTYNATVNAEGDLILVPRETNDIVPETAVTGVASVDLTSQSATSVKFEPASGLGNFTLTIGTQTYPATGTATTLAALVTAINADAESENLYTASVTDGAMSIIPRTNTSTVTIPEDVVMTHQANVEGKPEGIVFDIVVDGSVNPMTVDLSYLSELQPAKKFTGVEIAREITNQINKTYGDQRYFDFSSFTSTGEPNTAALFKLTVGGIERTVSLSKSRNQLEDLSKVTLDDAVAALQNEIDRITDFPAEVTVGYDPVRQSFTFKAADDEEIAIRSAGEGRNELFGLTNVATAIDADTGTWGTTVLPNGADMVDPEDQRFGVEVRFDETTGTFSVSSGTTGDTSSINIAKASAVANSLFGFQQGVNGATVDTSATPLRGIVSQPAVLKGNAIGINLDNKFRVDGSNNQFVVTVDNVTGLITMPEKADYTMEEFRTELERRINALADNFGRTVNGVKVEIDSVAGTNNKFFKFTTGTSGDNSFLKVSANSIWGLSDLPSARGTTSKWIEPPQAKNVDGFPLYVDRDGLETSDPGTFSEDETRDLWSPIFLDKGELTFDTGGNLNSPMEAIAFKSTTIGASGATLQFSIDYASSTQYSSPFSVLKQDQNGRPEGDLIGVDIGDDGLVSASYSNGTQKSLAKIVLVNFAAPTGLRQIGDASYYATSKSGDAKYGEAGSAGFGTVRAGARERANVDLTNELIELITAQRNFQANAKAIETNNTLTQAIINIRS